MNFKKLGLSFAASAFFATPSVAQYNYNYNQISPNFGYGTLQTPSGRTIQHNRQNIGNTQFDNFYGPSGSMNCTTTRIGNQVMQNCY